jgi:ketosteroid isomerase-like protein
MCGRHHLHVWLAGQKEWKTRIMLRIFLLALFFLAAPVAAKTPQAAVDQLLAADRAFSAKAAEAADPVTALAPMLDKEVVMPVPGKGLVASREAVLAAFGENPGFKEGKIGWTPIRGGISADGTQGFTYGLLSVTGGDPARRERKYLSYWVKRPDGWRVVAYRHQVREAGVVSKEMLPPSLPIRAVKAKANGRLIMRNKLSLAAAEKAFSDRAQLVGLRQAFHEFGRDDSMNMYNDIGFTIGRDAISAGFPNEVPAKIHWATDRSFVASSGDLGVSIGTIWPNKPAADGKPPRNFPFFTVWRRDGPDKPWRYIAE